MKLPSWLRSFWRGIGVGIIVVAVLFIVGGLSWLSWCYWWDWSCWEWLVTGSNYRESGSTTLRNLGFVVGGLIAIGFGIWRGVVADCQAKASQDQAKTSRRGLLNERYQKGAEMLGSKVLSVRLGGIYALKRLAEDEPEQYHLQITHLFCTFVSHPTEDEDYMAALRSTEQKPHRLREDVEAAIAAIGTRSEDEIKLEGKFSLILEGAYLVGAYLRGANLTGVSLSKANLAGAYLFKVNLTGTHLNGADLTGAYVGGANLTRAYLLKANLTKADLTDATLTNTNLSGADLTNADLTSVDLTNAVLTNATLTNATLTNAVLTNAILRNAVLTNAVLINATLDSADLTSTNLSGAALSGSDLTGVYLTDSDLDGAYLTKADLTGAVLFRVKGLTQGQLNLACADPDNPPNLHGARDAKTGKPLEWRGKPCEE